jgi:transcriptional regulator with XRE-family HTH domain
MPKITDFLDYAPESSNPETLAEKIKKYRIEHGLSQKGFAIQLGIDPLTVRRLENNRGKTNRKILNKILEILE